MKNTWGRHGRENLKTARKRFFDRHLPQSNGCIHWIGATQKTGYGTVRFANRHWLAHRLAWALINGDPGKLQVLHRCDNPRCVNVDHLFLGTHQDNMSDMKAKGRRKGINVGENHGRAKITQQDADEIRRLHSLGVSQRELARRYPIARPNIRRIVRNIGWLTT